MLCRDRRHCEMFLCLNIHKSTNYHKNRFINKSYVQDRPPPTHTRPKGAHNTVILRRHLEDKRVTAAWIRPFNFFFLYVIFHPSELFFCLSSFYPFVCLLSIHNLSLFSCIFFIYNDRKKETQEEIKNIRKERENGF